MGYQTRVAEKLAKNTEQLMHNDDIEKSIDLFINILNDSVNEMLPKKTIRKNKPKLRVWNEDIASRLKESRHAYWKWKDAGKPIEGNLILEKNNARKLLRKSYRIEQATRQAKLKDQIMTARTTDSKLFHKLVNVERKNYRNIDELYVDHNLYSGHEEVLSGFKGHFQKLATQSSNLDYDSEYHYLCTNEIHHIKQMVNTKETAAVTQEELVDAIAEINRGKAPDIFGITIEHIIHADKTILEYLLYIYI